jgi:molybdate transport system ATP-binding protein
MVGGKVRQIGHPEKVFTSPEDIDVAQSLGVETIVPGNVISRDGGLAAVRVGQTILWAVDPGEEINEVYVCVRAEEVTLQKAEGTPGSARNRLGGEIVEITPTGPLMQVVLDVGFRLVAFVTNQAVEELTLKGREKVVAVIKAPAIRLIPCSAPNS